MTVKEGESILEYRLEVLESDLEELKDEFKRFATIATRVGVGVGIYLVLHASGVPTENIVNIVKGIFATILGG